MNETYHERWRSIPDFEGYDVSNTGKVRTYRKLGHYGCVLTNEPQKELKSRTDKANRKFVHLVRNGKIKVMSVHHCVLTAFIGPRPTNMVCRHLDGNPQNNNLNNLKWGTYKENEADKDVHRTKSCGEKQWYSKLTTGEVNAIRFLYQHNACSQSELGRMFNVTQGCIWYIINRFNWKHL